MTENGVCGVTLNLWPKSEKGNWVCWLSLPIASMKGKAKISSIRSGKEWDADLDEEDEDEDEKERLGRDVDDAAGCAF